MSIVFDRDIFVNHYLTPIGKLADNISIVPHDTGVYTICTSQVGGSIVLYAEYKSDNFGDIDTKLNIPDIKKFIRLLSCIKNDKIQLDIKNNHLVYNDTEFRFKYFLLEEGIIPRSPINPDKIKTFAYNTTFNFSNLKFSELLKGSSIATESDKLYLYTKNGLVYAELNDYERQNINSICYQVADSFDGSELQSPVSLGLESVRLLAGLRTDNFTVRVNTQLKIVCFEYANEHTKISFIISGLVK